MANKRKKNSNPKRNAVLTILVTIVVAAVCLYTVLVGLGKDHLGSAKNIELGLDLAGGVSVTYEVNEENPSQTDMDDTRYKLQLRVQNYSTESEVYQEGSNRITVEIPGATDANAILEELGKPGDLSFQTEDGTVVLTGSNIQSAQAGTYDENGINNYVVSLTMDEEGKQAFADATANNIGKPIYIYYDGEVVSAPTVQSAITEGECVIENMESYEEAEELASTIRIGALPLTLTEVQSNVVGARLGQDVIIFTRIKEEINAGKSVINAIESGYNKALSAILDGNITTLIAAAVLWFRGSGTVKGFAQTLAIGIILSMFTALFVTKRLMISVYNLGLKDEKFYGRAKVFKVFNYIKFSKFCMIASAIVIILGFVFLPINKNATGNILNFDLDFSGGTAITMTLDDEITDELDQQICDTVRESVGGGTVQSQKVQGANELVVKTGELSLDQREALENTLKDSYSISDYQVQQITGSVSNEMRQDAVIAVAIASICMLIYVAFRFKDVKFGVSAVLALLHDVLCVFTVYSVARLSVGSTFIACMLTILGYSINATIVIFDRIRENLKDNQMVKQGLDVVVNTSISQTLTRSINTSLTTFITIAILYVVGVASIKEFSLTLMCGVVFGAYSSVCITGPLWYRMKMIFDRRKASAKKNTAKIEENNKAGEKKTSKRKKK